MDSSYEAEMFAQDQPTPMTCLGLPLDVDGSDLGTPIEVIIVAKVLVDGEFNYQMVSTSDLASVEAMGMLRWGQLLLEEGILKSCREIPPAEEETTDEQ